MSNLAHKTMKTVNGDIFIIDYDDYETVSRFRWYLDRKQGYILTGNGKTTTRLHRLILKAPDGMVVDHIDGNPLNNTKVNLRICTQKENCCNRRKIKKSSSIFKGVHYLKAEDNWQAYIVCNHRKKHIGVFNSEKMAAIAYNKEAAKQFGQFARLNEVIL